MGKNTPLRLVFSSTLLSCSTASLFVNSMHACDPAPIVTGLRLAAIGALELCYNPNFCRLANVTCKTLVKGQQEKSKISCSRDKETVDRQNMSRRKIMAKPGVLKMSNIGSKGPFKKYKPRA